MKTCECGEPVTDDWFRVHSVDGVLHYCPACKSDNERRNMRKDGV